MSKGKADLADDGFIQLSHKLDAALDIADLTKGQRIVIRDVKSKSFGLAAIGSKLKAVEIDSSNLAERAGCVRQSIDKALRQLVRACILIVDAKGRYKLNTWFVRWKNHDGTCMQETGSRFTRLELGFIEDSPRYAREQAGHINETQKPVGLDLPSHQRNTEANGLQNTSPLASKVKPVGFLDHAPPRPPYKEDAPGIEIRETEEREHPPTVPPTVGRAGDTVSLKIVQGLDVPITRGHPNWMEPPSEFVQLCKDAKEIKALQDHGFARTLYNAWNGPKKGTFQTWWFDERVPKQIWRDMLNEVASSTPSQLATIGWYLSFVTKPSRWEKYREAERATKKRDDDNKPNPYISMDKRYGGHQA